MVRTLHTRRPVAHSTEQFSSTRYSTSSMWDDGVSAQPEIRELMPPLQAVELATSSAHVSVDGNIVETRYGFASNAVSLAATAWMPIQAGQRAARR